MDDPLAGDTVSTRARVWHTPLPSCSLLLPLHLHALHALFCAWCVFWSLLCGPLLSLLPLHCRTHTHTFVARFLLPSLLFLVSFSFFVSCLKSRSPVVSGSGRDRQTSTDARGKIGLGFLCYELLCTAKVVLLATSWLTPRQMMLLLVLGLHL